MKTKTVKLDDLQIDPANVRKHDGRNIAVIKASLDRFKQRVPLLVRDGVVVAGNGRLQAMRELGWTKAVVIDAGDMTEEEARAYSLIDNRSTDLSEFDSDGLAAALDALGGFDMPLADLGFDGDGIAGMLGELDLDIPDQWKPPELSIEQDEVPELPETAVTKFGDTWELGRHRLVCGDAGTLAPSTDLDGVFTDPPYGVEYQSRVDETRRKPWGEIENDNLKPDQLADLVRRSVPILGYTYICSSWESLRVFEDALGRPACVCVWDKGSIGLGGSYRRQYELVMFYGSLNRRDLSDVWHLKRASNYQHPTQKPVELPAKAMQDSEMRIVYDPFLGSGTTLVAAEQLDRVCHGVEISPRWCDVVVERWQNLTNGKAKRV